MSRGSTLERSEQRREVGPRGDTVDLHDRGIRVDMPPRERPRNVRPKAAVTRHNRALAGRRGRQHYLVAKHNNSANDNVRKEEAMRMRKSQEAWFRAGGSEHSD